MNQCAHCACVQARHAAKDYPSVRTFPGSSHDTDDGTAAIELKASCHAPRHRRAQWRRCREGEGGHTAGDARRHCCTGRAGPLGRGSDAGRLRGAALIANLDWPAAAGEKARHHRSRAGTRQGGQQRPCGNPSSTGRKHQRISYAIDQHPRCDSPIAALADLLLLDATLLRMVLGPAKKTKLRGVQAVASARKPSPTIADECHHSCYWTFARWVVAFSNTGAIRRANRRNIPVLLQN